VVQTEIPSQIFVNLTNFVRIKFYYKKYYATCRPWTLQAIIARKDFHWLGMLLTKNVTLKSPHSYCKFFNSGMNEITKQCNEMARTIHCLTLCAMPIALLESWKKDKLKILTKSCTCKKTFFFFDLLHCEVLTERKHHSTPVNLSSLRLKC